MNDLSKEDQCRMLAPYVGRKCLITERGFTPYVSTLTYKVLSDLENEEMQGIQVFLKPLSSITEEDLIKVAEVATGLQGWGMTDASPFPTVCISHWNEMNRIYSKYFSIDPNGFASSWSWGLGPNAKEFINPSYFKFTCQIGYAPKSMFDFGLAIEE